MIDGRFDPHFVHLFVAQRANEGRSAAWPSLWPLLLVCLGAGAVFALALWLG